jgi:RNA polymerase sigma-70 factor (ECF subfamily)
VNDAYPSDLDELRRLGPDDRAVLYLSLVEGRTFAEIAVLVGISEAASRKRSSRALARLRNDLTNAEVDR